ncbi:TniQ family protein [Tolypothrix bouteillei]|uniref:TniQ family protein n=1 Tax=Tolypothrix bouteillei TaxID=1246981 RepID=UPI0038B521B3
MSNTQKLLRRPRPYPDESLAGYIIRLTENNYYHHPKLIFQISGLKTRGVYANVFIPEQDNLSCFQEWYYCSSSTEKSTRRQYG